MSSKKYLIKMAMPMVLALVVAWHAPLHSQTANPGINANLTDAQQKSIREFDSRIDTYVEQRKKVPGLKPTKNVADLELQRNAIKAGIRYARPNAKQGDIFDSTGDVFRQILAATLNGPNGGRIRATLRHAEPIAALQKFQLSVNGDYPNKYGQPLQSAPASLLRNLPALPKGIEYRVVGKTLVLRDAEANLVIDYLPNALP